MVRVYIFLFFVFIGFVSPVQPALTRSQTNGLRLLAQVISEFDSMKEEKPVSLKRKQSKTQDHSEPSSKNISVDRPCEDEKWSLIKKF